MTAKISARRKSPKPGRGFVFRAARQTGPTESPDVQRVVLPYLGPVGVEAWDDALRSMKQESEFRALCADGPMVKP